MKNVDARSTYEGAPIGGVERRIRKFSERPHFSNATRSFTRITEPHNVCYGRQLLSQVGNELGNAQTSSRETRVDAET
jgi:hypothetical protein